MADGERDRAVPVERGAGMAGDLPSAGDRPHAATAAILPVTEAMLDHAAHEAALLADGVAHARPGGAEKERAADAARAEPAAKAPASPEERTPSVPDVAKLPEGGAARSAGTPIDADGRDALTRYNAKLIEIAKLNLSATGDHVAALARARSVSEAASLNADHLRRQVDALTSQGRELAILAQQLLFDAFRPFRGSGTRGR